MEDIEEVNKKINAFKNAEAQRAWKKRNRDKVKKRNKDWNAKYRNEYQRAYRAKNKK